MANELSHPYKNLPDYMFWKRAVVEQDPRTMDPVGAAGFTISKRDAVAAAGSCFAQHISRHLMASGFTYLVTEPAPRADEPVFSARFGNVYTVRQLLQLFQRAYGIHRPVDRAWVRKDGRFIDPFRPQLFPEGFETAEAVESERAQHLMATRRVFEDCRVFIFTLGLTEAWLAADGTALPVHPGVIAERAHEHSYTFHNFSVAEMCSDMNAFLANLRTVNPSVKVILTVSPVPLIATYEDRHVLVSNVYSKSALRVVAEEISRTNDQVVYFPSFEVITSPTAKSSHYDSDLRTITEDGVSRVMELFSRHFLAQNDADDRPSLTVSLPPVRGVALDEETVLRLENVHKILCDEELLDGRRTT
jgi:hypothetical protein